ncbi:MAG: RNA methyltransferase [Lentisphaeria bacterium]|nr:RNA methyltransferase [Lentisphaeria bacterium]
MRIASLQNPRVKAVVRLRDRRGRDREQHVLIEGYRGLLRALHAGYPVHEVFLCPALFQGSHEAELIAGFERRGARIVETTEDVFRRMAYRDRPEGLLGIGPQVHRTLADLETGAAAAPLYLVAEAIEKPGNLGTMLRSADAAGVSGLILCDACTDLFNPNVVRASTGTLFTVPIAEATSPAAIAWLRARNVRIAAATPHSGERYTEADLTPPMAIVVGAEQIGLSPTWLDACDLPLRIPMLGVADSLNVATATALLLFEAMRQRLRAGIVRDPGPPPADASGRPPAEDPHETE